MMENTFDSNEFSNIELRFEMGLTVAWLMHGQVSGVGYETRELAK